MVDNNPSADQAFAGAAKLPDTTSDFNLTMFLIRQVLAGVNTAILVRVVNVYSAGEVAPAGLVDVQPMVNQIDGNADPTEHGIIYGLPYMRLLGGANAVIMDPAVGDIGVAVFCQRDISVVKNQAISFGGVAPLSNPGSFRQFSMADGVFLGGWPGIEPAQYLRFTAEGLEMVTPGTLTITATGDVTVTTEGNLTATVGGDLTVSADGDASVTAGGDAAVDGATVTLAGGGPAVARVGDHVNLMTGLITTGSSKVTSG